MREADRRKIRILYLTDTYVGGRAGSERHLQQVATALEPERYALWIVQLSTRPQLPIRDGLLEGMPHVRVLSAPVTRVYGAAGLRAARLVAELVRAESIDVVQSFHEKADLLSACIRKRAGRPARISSRRDMGFKKGRLLRQLFRFVDRRFDVIVAPSRAILDHLRATEALPEAHLRLVPNGVDLDRFEPVSDASRARARARLGLGAGQVVIGCVANLKPVKGHRYLVEGFARVARDYPDAVLVLVGEGELRASLEAMARAVGCAEQVRMAGQRDDVHEIMHAFDVVVSASLSEGLSNALIEAMAVGIPVVATAVGGNPEVVAEGRVGRLVPPEDAPALAEALAALADDPGARRDMGAQARRRVEQSFSLAGMMGAYRDLYETVCA